MLDLPDSPRKLVFRRIVKELRADAVFRRACPTILAWGDRPTAEESRPLTMAQAPSIRITPSYGPDLWTYPEAFTGWMFMRAEMMVPGVDVGDVMDLWWAFMAALYSPIWERRMAFQRELREVTYPANTGGARTGQIEFSQPVADPEPGDQYQHGYGEMKIEVQLNVNTDRGVAPWPGNS